ncbi:MAG: ATP-grasp domain-containing protein [Candidatus Diapherotrites archaeon]|uniref:ATP-grasp domain-containing protein n=1 Tax=Candidatus Iainarchaeum sp. TaxID=3101447 RepID=A0A8T3YMG2_9ARCH|nr:ATP-grasp domain-containing protein [Candidatus Diapherotrites archaeon]
MRLLVFSAEKQWEVKRILGECGKKKILCMAVGPKNSGKISPREFDAVLFRAIRGHAKQAISLARRAAAAGLVVVDEKLARGIDRSKLWNYALFRKAGLFVPKTILLTKKSVPKLAGFSGQKIVVKPLFGKRGEGLQLVGKGDTKKLRRLATGGKYMAQEFVPIKKEIRVMVIGGKVVGGVSKQTGNWVHNFYRGAKPVKARLTEKMKSVCLRAARAVQTEIAGIDLALTPRGMFVLEANRSPGFKAFEKGTGKNVAGIIVGYIAGRI